MAKRIYLLRVFRFCSDLVKCAYQHLVKLAVLEDQKKAAPEEEKRFTQATNIAKPVQYAVHLSVNDGHVQAQLKGQLDVNVVPKFVRSLLRLLDAEDVQMILSRPARPLPQNVLQVQLGDFDRVDDFLADLTIDRDPSRDGLRHNLLLIHKLHLESSLVCQCDDKFPLEPLFYLFVRFAFD